MGNAMKSSNAMDGCLKMDRILDSEHKIYIGIGSTMENKSSQVIRFGDYTQKYNRLIHFTFHEDELRYEFENDITMILQKQEHNILLEVCSNKSNIHIKKVMDPTIRKYHQKLCFASYELDRIYNFIHEEPKEPTAP